MTYGFIDSASISQLVQFLDRGMKSQYPWSMSEAINLTTIAIREKNLAVAPSIKGLKGVENDSQGIILDSMLRNMIVIQQPIGVKEKEKALLNSKKWIGKSKNINTIRDEVNKFHLDKRNYLNWLEWVIDNALETHSKRFGGLVDSEYSEYVARILQIDNKEMLELRNASADLRNLRMLKTQRNNDFHKICKAYLSSAILRGRYHEELSNIMNSQLTRHPIRSKVCRISTQKSICEIEIPRTASCLSNVILLGALNQKKLNDKIEVWANNVASVRAFLNRGGIRFEEGSDSAIMESAITIAKKANVQIANKQLDTFIDLIISLGIGTLTSISLSPWIGIPIGVGVEYTLKKSEYLSKKRNSVSFELKDNMLKDYMGGRIETKWMQD